jgi:anti-anti-sigma factor
MVGRRGDQRALESDAHTIVFDLSALTFIDSTGLSILARASGGPSSERVQVRGVRDQVARTLELTGLDRILPLAG